MLKYSSAWIAKVARESTKRAAVSHDVQEESTGVKRVCKGWQTEKRTREQRKGEENRKRKREGEKVYNEYNERARVGFGYRRHAVYYACLRARNRTCEKYIPLDRCESRLNARAKRSFSRSALAYCCARTRRSTVSLGISSRRRCTSHNGTLVAVRCS